jgi:D-glycero-alpha-D-manno-heptose-7-phosphate kinase
MLTISSAPLRISLLGGGTDMVEYWSSGRMGACLSMSIDRGVHCIIQDNDELLVDDTAASPITDEVIRDYTSRTGQKNPPKIHISFREDIPTRGTGMGSSSAWTMALLKGIDAWHKTSIERDRPYCVYDEGASPIAEQTYEIERSAGMSCGKQDHWAANSTGVKLFTFRAFTVHTIPLEIPRHIHKKMVLFNIGGSRNSETILKEQAANIAYRFEAMDAMARLAREGAIHLSSGAVDNLAECMLDAWRIKRTYADGVTNERIDDIYHEAINSDALAGKVLGAGGAGYMFFLCSSEKDVLKVQEALETIEGVKRVHFNILETPILKPYQTLL